VTEAYIKELKNLDSPNLGQKTSRGSILILERTVLT
jgi:hypothetical protein